MFFRAHGRRCAADFRSWNLPLTEAEIVRRLIGRGFRIVEVDMLAVAGSLVGGSAYRRNVALADAPALFDCSGFVKWLYGLRGVWLPRRAAQQFVFGASVEDDDIRVGDLVFRSGSPCPPTELSVPRVTHVGIVGADGRIFHAWSGARHGVDCGRLDVWRSRSSWQGARRIIPNAEHVITLESPSNIEIETSDDIRWCCIETLPWV